jgi:hypothetical protein
MASSPALTDRDRIAELVRLDEDTRRERHWKRWGPYLSERQWGTVREDYSANGAAWRSFPHEEAHGRAYRWGEDGLAGISDHRQRVCFALALWNGRDAILKERLFGLDGFEGNHAEDVKEYYYYLDSTPTHSYMRWLYRYPQAAYPYEQLIEEGRRRDRRAPEYELIDTGVFDDDRYFDVVVEYAKASPDDVLARIEIANRGPDPADLDVLPTVWFRNTWSWDRGAERPSLREGAAASHATAVELTGTPYGPRWLICYGAPELLFTDNETNRRRLYGDADGPRYAKDAFHDYVVRGVREAINPARAGTKAAARYHLTIPGGGTAVLRLRLSDLDPAAHLALSDAEFDAVIAGRRAEADAFYSAVLPADLTADAASIARQAFGGLLWTKQFYHYDVARWLAGDPTGPRPPHARLTGRNWHWAHLYNDDVISMPDKWEFPWYAAWDLAFHCVPLALVDPTFAKEQLVLFLREWYMHPSGQLPAYEWAFEDVNPPVHAWAAWRVYKIEKRWYGRADRGFLERVFHKLLLNFTWWVNRKDVDGRNVFEGGFLGLDNIGIFDRSKPPLGGGRLEQSDATSWMGMYCLNMLAIALELARENPVYEDVASKFFEHFVYICHAMNHVGGTSLSLWDEDDGFYYDVLHLPDGSSQRLKVRSMVGLIPLFAVETIAPETIERLPGFARRMRWFVANRPEFSVHVDEQPPAERAGYRLLSLVSRDRLAAVLRRLLDEEEFLSPYGVRSLSRYHLAHPYEMTIDGVSHSVGYEPGESQTSLFGGNSNWRGPVWLPVNFLIIESLQKFHYYLGDAFRVPCPSGSDRSLTLDGVAAELSQRLIRLFLRDDWRKFKDKCIDARSRSASSASSCATTEAGGRCSGPLNGLNVTLDGTPRCSSTSTSTAIPAADWARAIRPAGPRWWPS